MRNQTPHRPSHLDLLTPEKSALVESERLTHESSVALALAQTIFTESMNHPIGSNQYRILAASANLKLREAERLQRQAERILRK